MDAAGPSPAEAAVLNEALERRLVALADPELRQIALCGWKDTPTARSPTGSIVPRLDRAAAGADSQQMDLLRRRWLEG